MGLAALRGIRALLYAGALMMAAGALAVPGYGSPPAAVQPDIRVEARSDSLLAVGLVHDDRMVIHLSRLIDNAPVRDASLTVLLRGVVHPTIAEADGGYALESKDLRVPGSAAVVFQVVAAGAQEDLKGMLQVAQTSAKPEQQGGARQMWWWVLNFAVCIGFLMLLSRRRKAAEARGD